MAFDQMTRNRLQKFVGDARALLAEECARQLQQDYGISPATGDIAEMAKLTHLDETRRETARLLRAMAAHYQAVAPNDTLAAILDRIAREQAFTVLNRLCALRMAEARGLLFESVGGGYQSKGFQLYLKLAGSALGETGAAYQCYLFSLFDEFAVDMAALFDRYAPMGRLFPRESALLAVLAKLNDPDIAPLWAEDETIGWVYQYFNSVEERRQMRAESQAPRNSRELAVRNQFFTPRYVVEFLTDNTLGRIWYEMTQGQTALADSCRYLVRRPNEIFLRQGEDIPACPERAEEYSQGIHPLEQADGTIRPERATECSQGIHPLNFVPGDESPGSIALPLQGKNSLRSVPGDKSPGSIALPFQGKSPAQEENIAEPVYIPFRARKDPREIRMLDPACGSMHFGLYAFDLFERIYDEAWEWEEETTRPERATEYRQGIHPLGDAPGIHPLNDAHPLHAAYPDKAAFLRDVPRLILEQNIHGIDIDPRAAQIAGLSLWLRAQRSWQAQGVKAADRPRIRKTNVVCAEPMPGEEDLRQEFAATLTPNALGQMVEKIFKKMELAGEAGSLLKIEEEIADAVAKAREECNRHHETTPELFPRMFAPKGQYDFSDLPDPERFLDTAEQQIFDALKRYAEQAEATDADRRRLFAEDAARGFAFIDLCRKRYDVVLMNPPFGGSSKLAHSYIETGYSDSKNDILCAFVEMGANRLLEIGRLGAITARPPMFLSSMEKWRTKILFRNAPIKIFVDLGEGVLDTAMVKSVAYVLQTNSNISFSVPFFDATMAIGKEELLQDCCQKLLSNLSDQSIFLLSLRELEAFPNRSLAYWTSYRIRRCFKAFSSLKDMQIEIKQGLGTTDDFRFVRTIWETPLIRSKDTWFPYAKGGESQWFYGDIHLSVNWALSGKEIYVKTGVPYGGAGAPIRNPSYYGRPGLTYTSYTNKGFRPRILPNGCIFTTAGMGIFTERAIELLSLLNSATVQSLLTCITDDRKWEVGYVQAIPIPLIDQGYATKLQKIAKTCWAEILSIYSCQEESLSFFLPYKNFHFNKLDALLIEMNNTAKVAEEHVNEIMKNLESTILDLYELHESDLKVSNLQENSENVYEQEIDSQLEFGCDSITSYLLGAAIGRWDIRCATGAKQPPEQPDPFAPLPVCPPGMLQNADGLPAAPSDVPDDYPLRIAWGGILTDDEGHPDDIATRLREALEVVWGDNAGQIEQEACQILGVKSLREYLRKPARFFADHLKRYSKSRRQAPIYWPLSTASGSYTLWLYYHRLSDQTLYTCVNDFVEPKLKQTTEAADDLRRKPFRSPQEERELERLAELEAELHDFRAELLRLAPVWKPNLNDGVQITAAPLYKLFKLPAWQKTLKATWQALEHGEYDWAHLAYSLWPDRVRRACRTDRSYAIAHGLEAELWEEVALPDKRGKSKTEWRPKASFIQP